MKKNVQQLIKNKWIREEDRRTIKCGSGNI